MTDLIQQFHTAAERSGTDVGSLFERVVKTAYLDILKPGNTAIDVGAHQGYHMFPMADVVGRAGRIYAFEPIPVLHNALAREVKKRRLKQVRLHNYALSNAPGISNFTYFENMPAYSGLQQRETPFGDEEGGKLDITVECSMLDRHLPWFRKVSFVKMDIEGGEYHALLGAERLLKKSRPVVIFEHGQNQSAVDYNYTADEFFDLFERHDMEIFILSGEPYSRDKWNTKIQCWEYMAVPREKLHLAQKLPVYCAQVLKEVAEAA